MLVASQSRIRNDGEVEPAVQPTALWLPTEVISRFFLISSPYRPDEKPDYFSMGRLA
jgi:hypothetical protein